MAAGSGFGPSLGYVVGGNLLEIYVDHPRKPPLLVSPEFACYY